MADSVRRPLGNHMCPEYNTVTVVQHVSLAVEPAETLTLFACQLLVCQSDPLEIFFAMQLGQVETDRYR